MPGRVSAAWFASMVSLGKPRITGMVVITFLGGLWLAPGEIAHWRTIMTLIGTALLVAASNALNMYLERDADALMERTRDRPLPRAVVSPEAALAFGTGLTCVGIALVFLGSNLLTGLLGLLAVGGYVAVYTPLKRTSAAALFVGAVPGRAAAADGLDGGDRPPRCARPGAVRGAVPLADPALPGDRDLSRRRLRARRLQGAAADRVGARDARDHRSCSRSCWSR